MSIDKSTVDALAELAKLEFSETEKDELVKDLNRIIDFVDKLNELDTEEKCTQKRFGLFQSSQSAG
jgi:aspartyl-tRNA(Asn)/glutamyl-tRNA(Gln) amidotransferase subunit C